MKKEKGLTEKSVNPFLVEARGIQINRTPALVFGAYCLFGFG